MNLKHYGELETEVGVVAIALLDGSYETKIPVWESVRGRGENKDFQISGGYELRGWC